MNESNPAGLDDGQADIIDPLKIPNRDEKSFQPECINPNDEKITEVHESQETACSDIQDRCDQEKNDGSLFSYVPFNSPQNGFSDILLDQSSFQRSSVLDEVSKTLTNLYCDNNNTDVGGSQTIFETYSASLKVTKNISSDHSDIEDDQGLKKLSQSLSQCEISEKDRTSQLQLVDSQQCISSQQVKFACELKLMPSIIPDITQTDETSSDICSSCQFDKTPKCSQEQVINLTAVQKSIVSLEESADLSNKSSIEEHESISECATNEHNGINVCRSASSQQTTSVKSNIPLTYQTNISIKEGDVEMETSLENGCSSLLTHECDKETIADVELVIETLVENCCIVPVEHDENANNRINQYEADQSASDENRLDMRAENESGLYSERTSLAQDLTAGSGHTNSSPINEANIDVMEIGEQTEPSTDCQVPLALPCHDNYQQEIGKSHENVAALDENSSQNDICEVEACMQTSPMTHISKNEISQVSEEPQEAVCLSQTCSQKYVASNITCEKERSVHIDLNLEELPKGEFILSENAVLINNHDGNQTIQIEESEIEVPVTERVTPNTSISVSDMPCSLKLLDLESVKNDNEFTTNLSKEDLISNQDLTRYEDLKNECEASVDGVDAVASSNHLNNLEVFQKENVHVTEEDEHEKDIFVSHANDDLSLSVSLQALNQETREKVLTMHSMTNENIMDFEDSKPQDLSLENVSVSKCVTQEDNSNTSTGSLENDMGIVPNIPISQSGLSSDKSSNSSTHNTDCLKYQPTKTASSVQQNIWKNTINDQKVSKEDLYSDQFEDQIIGTQQFTAAISQVNIGDYLGVKYEASHRAIHTSDEACVVPELGHDLLLPRNEFHPECEDVSMYDHDISFKLKDKEPEAMECVAAEPAPCFKWKYAPSLNLDELPATDARNSDEDTLTCVLPLKTCTRPIRVGLSKKYRAKPLHKTQRL